MLMMMAAPSEIAGPLPFLAPPGPSPFSLEGTAIYNWLEKHQGNKYFRAIKHVAEHLGEGDIISVRVGDFITFPSVIVKDVNPVFNTRMDTTGKPISAVVTIVIQTYEILTRQAIQKAVFSNKG
jgi:hypothetical protein